MTATLVDGPLAGYQAQIPNGAFDAEVPVSRYVERTVNARGGTLKTRRRVRVAHYALTGRGFSFQGYAVR